MFDSKEENYKYRLQILNALLLFLDNIHEIIDLGLQSGNTDDFKKKLMPKYSLNDDQAQAIADVQVKRITKLQKEELQKEIKEINNLILYLGKE